MSQARLKDPWDIRTAVGEDIPFIYATWLNSYRDSEFCRGTRTTIFYQEYNPIIDTILGNPETRTLVACLPEDPNVIVGYLVHDNKALHYIFVKDAFSSDGVATSLALRLPEAVIYYTHRTWMGHRFIIEKFPHLNYNPFLLFNKSKGVDQNGRTLEIVRN